MKHVCSLVLLGAIATASGCGGGGSTSSSSSPASRADATTQPAGAATGSASAGSASPSPSVPSLTSPAPAAKADAATTQRVVGLPAGWNVAPRADYTARQTAGQVTVTAKGQNPTGGYEVKLIQSPLRIWPPQWILAHKKPDGPVTQAITPFEATASFKSDRMVATVVVNDASGRRIVSVAQDER